MEQIKVLSLSWKYHPSITSGVGVACEGLNNELSKIVDLTVIYPSVSKVKVNEEILLSSSDLTDLQKHQILKEYIEILKNGNFELPVSLDPYFTPSQPAYSNPRSITQKTTEDILQESSKNEIKINKISYKMLYEEVDVFGENVKDKIFAYNRLVEELAENQHFDIIHAHDWMTFLAGIHLKNKYKKPLVLHVHSLEFDRVGHSNVSWVYDVERYAMSKADKVISVSNYTKGIVESIYGLSGNNIETVYNAISNPGKKQEIHLKSDDKFKVLFAGRIFGNKGIEYFVDIARQILEKDNDIQFIVVGNGKKDFNFEEMQGFQEIASNFKYLGQVERERLFQIYRECDVLCMPSVSEPFGLAAIEAAYVGLPVVLSIRTGASEILKRTPKANFLDTKKFAKHVVSIKNNPKLRKRIITDNKKDVSKLSWKASAGKVLDIYNSLISR